MMRVAGAVDIGGTRTKIGIVADDGRVIESRSIPTPARGEPERLIDGIMATLEPLLSAAAAKEGGSVASDIGVSVAGFLDREHSTMYGNANLPALSGFPLKRQLQDRLGRHCVLEVDSNATVLAEHRFGGGRGSNRLLGVTVGTGLGGGVILDGSFLRHTGECAGDLGHIIVEPRGRPCSCGARGCLEAMVCSAALSERAGGMAIRDILSDARRGGRALNALAETARWLGIGLASLSPLFAPDTIVVGGGVAAAGEILLEPVRASYREQAGDDFRDRVRVVGSTFEGWDGIVGAASLVFQPMT
jgi:glucokinase